jgi:hypothetical protein
MMEKNMKQTITNGQLAVIVTNILGNPSSGEVDGQEAFERFCTDMHINHHRPRGRAATGRRLPRASARSRKIARYDDP